MTLFNSSFILLETVKDLLFFLFYLSSLLAYSVVSYALDGSRKSETPAVVSSTLGVGSGSAGDSALNEGEVRDSISLLSARVTDTYVWSEENNRYSLSSSQFNFKVFLEEPETKKLRLVDSGNISDNSEGDVRYLYVRSPKVVHFVSAVTGTRTILKARLSDSQEDLTIYLPEKDKDNILSGMIAVAGMDFSVYKNRSHVSDYSCYIKNRQLICVMDYKLRSQPDQALRVTRS